MTNRSTCPSPACARLWSVEPADLTVRILQEIRDDQRAFRQEFVEALRELRVQGERQERALDQLTREHAARFEVIETTLRDLAQQLVVLGRGVKVAIDERRERLDRWDDHERRIADLERRAGVGRET
jgi:hypothetical protein